MRYAKCIDLCARTCHADVLGSRKNRGKLLAAQLARPQICTVPNFYAGLLRRGGGLQLSADIASALLLTAKPWESLLHGILYSYWEAKKKKKAMSLSYFPPSPSLPLTTGETGVHARNRKRTHPRLCTGKGDGGKSEEISTQLLLLCIGSV